MTAASLSPRSDAGTKRVSRPRAGAVRALVRRDWSIMRSYRAALVSDLLFGFLNLVVYHFISRTLRPRVGHELGTAPSYFAFAAVGVAMTIVLQAAVSGLGRRVREEQLTGTLETLLAQPLGTTDLALGLAGFPCLFAVVRAILYLLLAGAFLGLSFAHASVVGLLASFVAAGLAFAGIGITLAALVLVFKRAEAAGSISAFGLGLLGGAVFPTSVLPGWLRTLSHAAPTRFAFEAVRQALFGGHGWLAPCAILLGFGIVLSALSLALFHGAIRLVLRLGTINQY